MSLNGLDTGNVKEAHDAAVAEPGGWFLLKYLSRDEIDVLSQGHNGIVEMRNAIAQYEEDSPLFGYLRYRRRSILIKYVPDGCSRLLQARYHVHFNAFSERFSPYDTIFDIATSKELKDSALSAACSLHTASGSTSSSTSSLRRRRLMEIAEDEEEETRAKRQSTVVEERSSRPSTAQTLSIAGSNNPLSCHPPDTTPPQISSQDNNFENSFITPPISQHQPSTAPATNFVAKNDLETFPPPPRTSISEPRSHSPTKSADGRRLSSQSLCPDLHSYNSYGSNGRPKVKLGPRPSLDAAGRPGSSPGDFRSVSTLPAGLKLLSRRESRSRDSIQAQLTSTGETQSLVFSPPSIPESCTEAPYVTRPHTSGGRPTTSSGASIMSTKSAFASANMNIKKDTMTPEKARLMKALQMRKKQMASPPPTQPLPPLPGQAVPTPISPVLLTPEVYKEPLQERTSLAVVEEARDDESAAAMNVAQDTESDATRTISTPNSPMEGQSTKASSISDSTDETAHEVDHDNKISYAEDRKPDISQPFPVSGSLPDTIIGASSGNAAAEDVSTAPAPLPHDENKEAMDVDPDVFPSPPSQETYIGTKSLSRELSTTPILDENSVLDEHAQAIPDEFVARTSSLTTTKAVPASALTLVQPEEVTESSELSIDNSSTMIDVPSLGKKSVVGQDTEAATNYSTSEPLAEATGSRINSSGLDSAKNVPKQITIPRSKFSVQDLQSENTPIISYTAPVIQTDHAQLGHVTIPEAQNSPLGSTFSQDSSISQDDLRRNSKRMKGNVEPIRTDLSVTDRSAFNTDNEFSDDEDLMDELQSASVQQAMPISVSKSPITPIFPSFSPNKMAKDNRASRVFSSPTRKSAGANTSNPRPVSQSGESIRSVSASAAYLQRIQQQQAAPVLAKKVNIGSSISQRIKALESNLNPDSSATTAPPQNASPAFFSVRKPSVRSVSRGSSIAERTNSLTLNTSSPTLSRAPSQEVFKNHDRSGSVASKLSASKVFPEQTSSQKSSPESIQVTARIVRDPELQPSYLQESVLVINHHKGMNARSPPPPPPKDTPEERRLSISTDNKAKKDRRSSATVVKDIIESSRSSFSSHRQSATVDPSPASRSTPLSTSVPASISPVGPRPSSVQSRGSMGSRENSASTLSPTHSSDESSLHGTAGKKEGRASRMMRRMSSSLSASRKTIAHAVSPTVREDIESDFASTLAPSTSSGRSANADAALTIADIGDVNVQFPDTLLWKRRSVRLDSAGFIILSPASSGAGAGASAKVAVKRIHLSSFHIPFVPDAEIMEMPNSVVLRFIEGMVDGSSSGYGGAELQIACEDRGGQTRALQVLQEAHASWATFGQ